MSEQHAINVYDEAHETYMNGYVNLPDDMKPMLSIRHLQKIWEAMARPSIEQVRQIDRKGRSESSASPAG